MANDVQQLLLKIDANTELARRELRKMDSDFDTFTRRSEEAAGGAESAFGRLDKAAGFAKASIIGFAAGIGIDGIVTLGRTILEAADDLGTAADQAGVGVERFQTLTEALRVLEVDSESVSKIFGRLIDVLGQVQGGTAAAGVTDALDKMGITTRILNGEINSTDGLLDAIAASAGKFNTEAEFTAAVIDLVGKRLGVQFAAALKDGGAALKENEQAFRDAGGVVDKEYIAKLADANEAIDRFTSNSKSRLIIWAGETIGFFERAANAADDYARRALNAIDAAAGVKAPAQTVAGNGGARGRDDATLKNLRDQGLQGSAVYRSLEADYRKKYGLANVVLPVDEEAITVTGSRLPRGGGGGGARAPAPARRAAPPAINDALNRQSGYEDFTGALTDGGGKFKDVADQLDGIKVNLGEINVASVDLANAQIFDLDNLAAGNGLLRDAAASITDAIFGATSLGDALVGTFARAGAALIESAIFDALGGLIGLGGGGGGVFGKAKKLLGFANGGQPPVGVPSIVGERGPELFVPRVPGTIIPNHKLGGGGGGTTIYNDFKGAVVTEELYARIDATGQRAAQAGALGGRQMAAADQSRARRRSMVG